MSLLTKSRRFAGMSWGDRWVHLRYYGVRYLGLVTRLLLSIVYFPTALLLRVAGVRFLVSSTSWPNFGHSALEPDLYMKAAMTGVGDKHRAVMLAPRKTHPYRTFTEAWKEHFTVVDSSLLCALLRPFEWISLVTSDITSTNFVVRSCSGDRLSPGAAFDEIIKRYHDQFKGSPILRIPSRTMADGLSFLGELGVSSEDWWVTFHVRENNGTGVSVRTSAAEDSRNADPSTYLLAIKTILERGGRVIRIGGGRETQLPQIAGLVDLTRISDKPEGIDLVAIAGGKMLLSSDSGPNSIAMTLSTSIAGSNFFPLNHGTHPGGIYIPKLLVRKESDSPLPFADVLSTRLRDVYQTQDLEREGLTWRDNSEDEIEAAAIELLDALDGVQDYSDDEEQLQSTYWRLAFEKQSDSSYGTNSRIGNQFLLKWRHLLPGAKEQT